MKKKAGKTAAIQALQDARAAIALVYRGKIDRPSVLRFEGVRAYSVKL